MPGIGIGIGFDSTQIRTLMKELCIKTEREEFLKEMLSQCMQTNSPIDDLQRVIARCTKANEVVFLSFLIGVLTGSQSAIFQLKEHLPDLVQSSLIAGAEHSEEIKKMVKAMNEGKEEEQKNPFIIMGENAEEIQKIIDKVNNDELEITPTKDTKKKKDEPQDDPMYR